MKVTLLSPAAEEIVRAIEYHGAAGAARAQALEADLDRTIDLIAENPSIAPETAPHPRP